MSKVDGATVAVSAAGLAVVEQQRLIGYCV
jgi:hypothetical protein